MLEQILRVKKVLGTKKIGRKKMKSLGEKLPQNTRRFNKKSKDKFELDRLKFVIDKYQLKNPRKYESPDCLAQLEGKTVGLELVRVMNPDAEQGEQFAIKICNDAQEEYEKRYASYPVSVSLDMAPGMNLRRLEVKIPGTV